MNIDIELKNIEMALDTFNHNLLSRDLDNYIITTCENKIIKNKNINLNISGISKKEEQNTLIKIIHNYYQNKTIIFHKIDNLDNYVRACFAIIGIIIILISKEFDFLLSELFLIAGWVIIWEIVYDILFNEIKRKRKKKIYSKLSSSNITFHE